ncbi:DUF2510 domain-containing protein [Microbacterium caowuchunii]|uniref:DUF2510 domain-containing protein n=1 Tax=Microbacterium caowuchunii TaxID=2614638 RepID=UPI001247C895|nr:DUF2510 domain-containing protein [Microbacterium caowuchunii]QEW00789.1 DUF2510 domain-containing protein [Microbacterium caowuchunii]
MSMSDPQPSAPAGWYDAGVPGWQRWWDGTAWTDRQRPAATPAVAGPPAEPAQPVRPGWGQGAPEASIIAGVFACLLIPGAAVIGLFALAGNPVLVFGSVVACLALTALAVVAFLNAAAAFRRRRETPPG